jgi:hypothetical protein
MDHPPSSNGHHPPADDHEPVNAYADAILGSRPRELVDFELRTDPYANMLPTMSRHGISPDDDPEPDEADRRRNPLIVGISVLLIILLVLPPLVVVFARLGL